MRLPSFGSLLVLTLCLLVLILPASVSAHGDDFSASLQFAPAPGCYQQAPMALAQPYYSPPASVLLSPQVYGMNYGYGAGASFATGGYSFASVPALAVVSNRQVVRSRAVVVRAPVQRAVVRPAAGVTPSAGVIINNNNQVRRGPGLFKRR